MKKSIKYKGKEYTIEIKKDQDVKKNCIRVIELCDEQEVFFIKSINDIKEIQHIIKIIIETHIRDNNFKIINE